MTNSQTKTDLTNETREKIADILRTGYHGIAETKVVNHLITLLEQEYQKGFNNRKFINDGFEKKLHQAETKARIDARVNEIEWVFDLLEQRGVRDMLYLKIKAYYNKRLLTLKENK